LAKRFITVLAFNAPRFLKGLRVVVSSKKKLRSQFRVVLADSSGDLLFFFAELPKNTGGLDVEPEPCALFEKFAEFQGHLGHDAAAAENDFVDASRADAEGSREGILRNAHGNEIVLKENFTGCNGGFHRGIFIRRFRRFSQIKSF